MVAVCSSYFVITYIRTKKTKSRKDKRKEKEKRKEK